MSFLDKFLRGIFMQKASEPDVEREMVTLSGASIIDREDLSKLIEQYKGTNRITMLCMNGGSVQTVSMPKQYSDNFRAELAEMLEDAKKRLKFEEFVKKQEKRSQLRERLVRDGLPRRHAAVIANRTMAKSNMPR
jgi:hypothetical protein